MVERGFLQGKYSETRKNPQNTKSKELVWIDVKNLTSIYEDGGSIPCLAQWDAGKRSRKTESLTKMAKVLPSNTTFS